MSHTITTDAQGRGTFTCTMPANAKCHEWADCLSYDGCDNYDSDADERGEPECQHPVTVHATCLYSEWYDGADAVECMHLNPVTQESDVRPPASVAAEVVTFEWDECPLWSFPESVYLDAKAAADREAEPIG